MADASPDRSQSHLADRGPRGLHRLHWTERCSLSTCARTLVRDARPIVLAASAARPPPMLSLESANDRAVPIMSRYRSLQWPIAGHLATAEEAIGGASSNVSTIAFSAQLIMPLPYPPPTSL